VAEPASHDAHARPCVGRPSNRAHLTPPTAGPTVSSPSFVPSPLPRQDGKQREEEGGSKVTKMARGDSPCPLPVALHAKLPCPAPQACHATAHAHHTLLPTHRVRGRHGLPSALPPLSSVTAWESNWHRQFKTHHSNCSKTLAQSR
jgi:hypothetical protein